ncbi:MAG: enoyl-CoA hydratase-related protein [Anaerotardibacter sp.]
MEFETIITEERDNIFIITLNRTKAKNAVNNQMCEDLAQALEYWDTNDNLRACILTNNGDVFCAGSDLKEIAKGINKLPEGKEDWGFACMTRKYWDKPLIAAVKGKCLGGGLEIVVACDLAVCADDSIFGYPEPRVGLTAAGGGSLLRIGQHIPVKFANELLLVAEPIDAQTAHQWGIINHVVPEEEVLDKAVDLAEKIALGAPLAIKYSKRTLYETLGTESIYPSKGWEILDKYMDITHHSEDSIEGSSAFAEKRPPVWKGR